MRFFRTMQTTEQYFRIFRRTNMENVLSVSANKKAVFIARTYGWMGLALLISAAAAFFTALLVVGGSSFGRFLYGNGGFGVIIFAIAEIAIVWWLSASIRKLSVGTATAGFIVYALINGITLSSVLLIYRVSSIALSFAACSAMFFAMSFYGATTKKNLMSWGKYLMMALVGIIIASLFTVVLGLVFRQNVSFLDFLISVVCVVVFTALTAYDAQKVTKTAEYANESDDYKKVSILAALELYLDFINIFLALIRIFGRRRD